MSKLTKLTEDRYTLSDIFTKSYQIWALIPLVLFLCAHFIHIIVYAVMYEEPTTSDQLARALASGEYPGDYYKSIVHMVITLGAIIAVIAYLSFLSAKKQTGVKLKEDGIPMYFFLGYIALMIVSTIINKTDSSLIFGHTIRSEGILQVIAYFVVYYLCASLISKPKYKYFIVYFLLVLSFVIGVLTIIDKYIKELDFIYHNGVCGIFYHWNFYAYFLSITLLLCAGLIMLSESKAIKVLCFINFCMNTFILAANDSLGGFLATIVAMLFLCVAISVRKKKFSFGTIILLLIFFAIIFVTGFFTQSYFSELTGLASDVNKIVTNDPGAGSAGTGRWALWKSAAKCIKEKPLFGWGFEGITEQLYEDAGSTKTHNEYLENMAYYGIPAGLLYLGGLIAVFIKAIKKRHELDDITLICLCGALAYIGSALVGNSIIITAPFFFIFLGLANQTNRFEKAAVTAQENTETTDDEDYSGESVKEPDNETDENETDSDIAESQDSETAEAVLNNI